MAAPQTNTAASKADNSTSTVPNINWRENKGELIWKLLNELDKKENRHVFLGKVEKGENTRGESRAKVCKRIGETLFPGYASINAKTVGERVRSKVEALISTYKEQASRLRVTGGGVTEDSDTGSESTLQFYIFGEGPDDTTPDFACNLWDEINKHFPYFARLHKMFGTRPNVVPIAVTTGVGPSGPQTVYYQAPDGLYPTINPHLQRLPPQAPSVLPDGLDPNIDPQLQLPPSATMPPVIALPIPTHEGPPEHEAEPQTPVLQQGCSASFGTDRTNTVTKTRQPPRPSTQSRLATERAAAVQLIPQKRTPIEAMLDLSRENMAALHKQQREAQRNTNFNTSRKLLLDEFKLGIWSAEEYKNRLKKLEKSCEAAFTSPPAKKQRQSISDDDDIFEVPSSDI